MKKLLLATAFTLLTTNAYAIDFYCTNFDGTGEDRFISDYSATDTLKTGSLVWKNQCDRIKDQTYIDPIANANGQALGAKGSTKPWLSYWNINVRGLEDVHKQGWTGKGVNVVYFDALWSRQAWYQSKRFVEINHARQTITIGKSVAPDQNAFYYDSYQDAFDYGDDYNYYGDFDVAGGKKDKWQHVADTPSIDREWLEKNGESIKVSNASMSPSSVRWNLVRNTMPNTLQIESAGNYSKMEYEDLQKAFIGIQRIESYLDNYIIVGAVTKNGKSTFTRPGNKYKHKFMVAHNETTIYDEDIQGTSFSAPRVAGVATLLRGKYPAMSAEEAMVQMLTSAKDLGEPGVDAVFGWGLLDAGSALSPIAALR